MKKLFVGVLAIAGLVACAQEEVLRTQAPGQIGFDGVYVENAVRAAEDPSTTTDNLTAFDVWGYMTDGTGIVFNREVVSGGTGAWDYVEKALTQNGIGYVNFDKVTPNPTTHHVDEAVKMALDFGAKAVIAIGGGSPVDAGKSTAILMEYPDKTCNDLYEFTFTPSKAAPIVAINLTHGTGTETNRFAVVTVPEKDFKPAIAYDCIYPYA